jgi:hypothetical protein
MRLRQRGGRTTASERQKDDNPTTAQRHHPTLIRLLAAPAAPASRPGAILGLLLLTAFVLWIASLAARRMQISYGTET